MPPVSIDDPDPDSFPCPTCGRDDFSREQDMRIHHTKVHGERLVDLVTCEECGDSFEYDSTTRNRFCSLDCASAWKTQRVEKTCQECGDIFDVPKHETGRQYCSRDCYSRSLRDTVTIECEGCGFLVQRIGSRDARYCGHACYAETRCSKPRPDDLEMLAWLLYEYEDNTLQETYKRINCNREDSVSRDTVSEILTELGVLGKSPADRIRRQVENGQSPFGDGETA